MRLLGISLGTLLIAFLIGLILRFWGLSLPHRTFDHPFFRDLTKSTSTEAPPPLRIPVFNSSHFNFTPGIPGKASQFSSKTGDTFQLIWVSFYITADKKLITDYGFNVDGFLTWAREKNQYKGKYLHAYKFDELAAFWSEIVLLETVVNAFPTQQFIFNVLSNDLDIHKEVVTFVEAHNLSQRVLINSPIDIVIKAVKEIRPMWIYGTSISEVTRIKTFSTMQLEPAIGLRGDVFVAPVSYLARPLADESLVTEMKRRKKIVLIGPLVNDSEMKSAEELKPDGIIF